MKFGKRQTRELWGGKVRGGEGGGKKKVLELVANGIWKKICKGLGDKKVAHTAIPNAKGVT